MNKKIVFSAISTLIMGGAVLVVASSASAQSFLKNKQNRFTEEERTQLEQSSKQFVPPKSKDELEAWRQEYPDVYDMVETIAMTKADARAKEIEEKYQNLQAQQEQISKEKAEVELLKMHPDFSEIRQKDEFHQWASKQDPVIQSWLYENTSNAQLAGRAIDLYKMDNGTSKLNKKQDIEKGR